MTTKVEPTVEKWEEEVAKRLDKLVSRIIKHYEYRLLTGEKSPFDGVEGGFEDQIEKHTDSLFDYIRTLKSHSVQEAKAEERERILQAIQPAVNDFMAAANTLVEHKMVKTAKEMRENTQYIVCAIRGTHKEYAASLKQEEDGGEGDIEQLWYEQGVFDEEQQ